MLFWWPCTYDTALEFTPMSQAGMNYQQILASLTTNPAWKFRCSDHGGRIAKGMDGDLVVLGADPAENVSAFFQGALHNPGWKDHLRAEVNS